MGITEYISDHPGFRAILKHRYSTSTTAMPVRKLMRACDLHRCLSHRYSDFIVHEIDMEGNVVRLTDMSLPLPPGVVKHSCSDHASILCIEPRL